MAIFKLQPDPTFKVLVPISVPGQAEPAQIEIEFKWMDRKAAEDYFNEAAKLPAVEGIGGLIVGWSGVDTPYSREALATLLLNYANAGIEIVDAYRRELLEAKRKN